MIWYRISQFRIWELLCETGWYWIWGHTICQRIDFWLQSWRVLWKIEYFTRREPLGPQQCLVQSANPLLGPTFFLPLHTHLDFTPPKGWNIVQGVSQTAFFTQIILCLLHTQTFCVWSICQRITMWNWKLLPKVLSLRKRCTIVRIGMADIHLLVSHQQLPWSAWHDHA